jgi:hypothetical protein
MTSVLAGGSKESTAQAGREVRGLAQRISGGVFRLRWPLGIR